MKELDGVKDVHAAMMRIRRRLGPELRRRLAELVPAKKDGDEDDE